MKAGLSEIIRGYGYKNAEAFYKDYFKSRNEYAEYKKTLKEEEISNQEKALQEYEKNYNNPRVKKADRNKIR